MIISIKQKVIESILAHANWIIEKKQVIPVLGCALFDVSHDNELIVISTNMDLSIVDTVKCDVSGKGRFCLPAGLLYDIVKKSKAVPEILFEYSEGSNSVKIISNKTSFIVKCMDHTNYPSAFLSNNSISNSKDNIITSLNNDVSSIKIDSKVLRSAISIARIAMLQDNSRFNLNGIYIHKLTDDLSDDNELRFVATDLFRISCVSVKVSDESTCNVQPIIISKRTASEVVRLIDNSNNGKVNISISNNKILFSMQSYEEIKTDLSARLVCGTFPEYEAALDVTNDKTLIVNTKELIDAIDRVSTVILDTISSVKLTILGNKLTISGVSNEVGSATEEIDVEFNYQDQFEICFNSKYLLDALREIKTPQTKIMLNSSNSSTLIKPVDLNTSKDIEIVFVVMPIEIVKN